MESAKKSAFYSKKDILKNLQILKAGKLYHWSTLIVKGNVKFAKIAWRIYI